MIELMVACNEPGGARLRRVREATRTPEEVAWIIQKVRGLPNMFETADPFRVVDMLDDPENLFLLVDDVGLICIQPNPQAPHVADAHITFWDRRLRGREVLCKAVARMLFSNGLKLLWTVIPKTSLTVASFAKRIGFREIVTDSPTYHHDHFILFLTEEALHGT